MKSAHTNSILAYINSVIADAVQQDVVLEIQTLQQENTAITGFMTTAVLNTDVKQRAADALAEVLADNLMRLKVLCASEEMLVVSPTTIAAL